MQFTYWLVVIVAVQTGLSIKLTINDIRNIYKARMDKRTFEVAKNLHLNWYIYAIKALFGQVGKQMYQQLAKDQQETLAACLNQIKDDRDLVTSAKCLMQARNESRKINQSADTQSFITRNDSEEEEEEEKDEKSLESNNYERKNVAKNHPTNTAGKTHMTRSENGNKFLTQHSLKASIQSSESSIVLDSNQTEYFIPNNFKHLTVPTSVPHSADHSKKVYLNRRIPVDRKSMRITGENETFKTFRLIEDEMRESTNIIGHSSHYKKVDGKGKDWKELELMENVTRPLKFGSFHQRNDWYVATSNSSSSEHSQKLHSNSLLSKFGIKEVRKRQRRSYSYRLITNHVMKSDHVIVDVKQANKMPAMYDSTIKKTPIQQLSKFISVMVSGEEANDSWTQTYEHITKVKEQMDQQLRAGGGRVYNLRLLDLVLDNKKPTTANVQSKYKDFISMTFDLVNGVNQNSKNEKFNFRLLSPRMMPLIPDKTRSEKRILSPSIMPFYKDDSSNNIVSLPELLEKSGMEEKDRQAVMEMIMDVSGARAAVKIALDILNKTNVSHLDGIIFEATKRINQAFKDLEKSFNIEQQNDLERKGFAFLEASQLKQILHQQGVRKLEDVNFDLKKYEQLNRKEKEETLWEHIERIAKDETKESYRMKRETLSASKPVILAPFMFSPTFGLSILGPVVLSPSIFSPLILNPSILGPYILSPGIFLPFLISPYILSPYVLSPLVGAPYVLSPYVLSPNVINPYVLSPLVLSPYILSPDIISPQALGGQILSPNAFSPSIYTDNVLSVSVLSPSWMSK